MYKQQSKIDDIYAYRQTWKQIDLRTLLPFNWAGIVTKTQKCAVTNMCHDSHYKADPYCLIPTLTEITKNILTSQSYTKL